MAPRPGPPLGVSVFRDEQRVEWQHVVNLAAGSDDCPPLRVNPNINAGMHVDSCEHETCLHATSMCSILVISSDAAARERWSQALQLRGRRAVALPPGLDARATSTEDLDAIVIDVELSGDWQHLRVLAENRGAVRAPRSS